jgi:hypothetical protein
MRVTSATLLLPPLCFCINCPLERVALDLSHRPPSLSVTLPACGGGGGVVSHPPDPNPPPPKTLTVSGQKSWMGDENCGGELDLLHFPPTQFSSPIHGLLIADHQCLGGGGWATTPPPPPTPQAGRVTDSHGGEG